MIKPKLLIIAGPNGTGKTSLTDQILRHEWTEGCEYINPDIIARDRFGDWNSSDAVLKAAQWATDLREKYLLEKRNFIFETVLSATDKIFFIERAKQQGYFIRLFFIGTDSPTINASRIACRVIAGGHDVPIPKVISRYHKSILNCSKVVASVDRLYVYDNSVDNMLPKLLFRATEGKIVRQYVATNEWAKQIKNCCL